MNEYLQQVRANAIQHLASSVHEDGHFNYAIDLRSGSLPFRSYNLVRHGGCTLCLFENFDIVAAEMRSASLKALSFCLSHLYPISDCNRPSLAIVKHGEAKLGATALTLASLTQYLKLNNTEQHMATAEALGNYLLSQQGRDGKFASVFCISATNRTFDSLYYPGEAILALTRLARVNGCERYLEAAHNGALFLAKLYSGKKACDLPADHWLLLAINELDQVLPSDLLLATAIRLADSIVQSAIIIDESILCWGADARFCPASTRAEGLGAALQIAVRHNIADKAFSFLVCLERAISFVLLGQVDKDTASELPFAVGATGAFIHSRFKPIVRMDYVQHGIGAINALIYARNVIHGNRAVPEIGKIVLQQ